MEDGKPARNLHNLRKFHADPERAALGKAMALENLRLLKIETIFVL
jgi:hypothetical protein